VFFKGRREKERERERERVRINRLAFYVFLKKEQHL